MCFAMLSLTLSRKRIKCFNSLFVGMCFAIGPAIEPGPWNCDRFNSLFVGMCFAIRLIRNLGVPGLLQFQFPFRRDVLCNTAEYKYFEAVIKRFQFPFRRDVLCNARPFVAVASSRHKFQFPFRRDVLCNPSPAHAFSLLVAVSIPFSSGCALQS